MTDAIRGGLISAGFARTILPTLPGVTMPSSNVESQFERVGDEAETSLGLASSARSVADVILLPLLRALGLSVRSRRDAPDEVRLYAIGSGPAAVPILARAWGDDLDDVWRGVVRDGIAADARWCLATNGRQLRFVDAHHTWSRRVLDLEVPALGHDSGLRHLLWMVGNSAAITHVPAILDTATRLSAEHGAGVCRSLGDGVARALAALFQALRTGTTSRDGSEARLLEQCLTVIYRILFLLFAEARGLVPVWHPLYREQYTIGSIVSTLIEGRPVRGAWRAVQAITRMAHAGCTAGGLSVTAFNGRLFSPAQTAGVDERRIDDDVMGRVVLGLSTTRSDASLIRTRYEELDVEQLGSVYEHVLEYQPDSNHGVSLVRTRDSRKTSGTFYTPRAIAASLVKHTLEPLVNGRTAAQILDLRLLDPAMGSGAFLVAACRYLARRVEVALIAEGSWHAADVTDADRAGLRREIVQRCLYGVDLNPVAVQLARLSLWLVALAHDKPLSFLDHHLIAGNSLIGATPFDVCRSPGGTRLKKVPLPSLPLFDEGFLAETLTSAGRVRVALALEPDDTVDCVRSKERRLAALVSTDSSLGTWRRVLDLWCATWFWDADNPPDRPTFVDVSSSLLTGRSVLRRELIGEVLRRSDRRASELQFLHWPLAFPEVFQDTDNQAGAGGGFDAVIGNPPWDMLRGDTGNEEARDAQRNEAHHMTRFVRQAGVYPTAVRAHLNRYALFTERALQLVRQGGRIGLVLPGGVLTDSGMGQLRARLFASTALDRVIGLDNRAGIFPVHRGVKFVLLTATSGSETTAVSCRFGVSRLDDLEVAWNASGHLTLTRTLLERISGGDDLGVPELTSSDDLRILEAITEGVPTLDSVQGWHVRFGRELNASDDRALMIPATADSPGRPVVEGKLLTPFKVALKDCSLILPPRSEARRLIARRQRLGYREVAASTNRLTLIAAMVPAHAVTTHTVFCLKTVVPLDSQRVLCALLNSFVANYLVRMRVTTHVTASVMSKLRVPFVQTHTAAFNRLLELSRVLSDSEGEVESSPAFIDLQALVARLYGLGSDGFSHVLATFPLIPRATRDACLAAFNARR